MSSSFSSNFLCISFHADVVLLYFLNTIVKLQLLTAMIKGLEPALHRHASHFDSFMIFLYLVLFHAYPHVLLLSRLDFFHMSLIRLLHPLLFLGWSA